MICSTSVPDFGVACAPATASGATIASDNRDVWALGAPADERNAALEGLAAPDFTLPDVNGVPRSLSQLKGKKVFLATWASW